MEITPIAHIENDYEEKFGVPRQSGLAPAARSRIVLEPPFRSRDALRGIEEFSHLWLIWEFTRVPEGQFSPTVRPPRLGGNARMGVFATRSPFRPNRLGLSCVKLEAVSEGREGPELTVSGADLVNGTLIYDIKPYLPYADCVPDARGGFTEKAERKKLRVVCDPELMKRVPPDKVEALFETLAQDPRPSYQHDPEREYGMAYGGMNVRFRVAEDAAVILGIDGKAET